MTLTKSAPCRLAQNIHEALQSGIEPVSEVVQLGPHRDRPLCAVWTQKGDANPVLVLLRETPTGATRSLVLFDDEVRDLANWLGAGLDPLLGDAIA